MKTLPLCVAALACAALSLHAAQTLDFYVVDVGQGNATIVVTPSGQTMLFDAGPVRTAGRVLAVMKEAGVDHLDYLVVSHFHEDHFGGAMEIASKVKVANFVDHGPSVEAGRSDDWWKALKEGTYRPDMRQVYDDLYGQYTKTIESGKHTVVNPGDKIPARGLDVLAVCSRGKFITTALPGAGKSNAAACADTELRHDDYAEDGQSIGLLFTLGKFRFIQLGDLTWNFSYNFFCPNNLIGTVDAYVISHHARSYPRESGENSWSWSSCPRAEVYGLHPRVAVLSLSHGGGARRDDAMKLVHNMPGLEDLWQTEKILNGPEKEHNAPEQFLGNLAGNENRPLYIKLSARPDGSFTVTNSRNGFSKSYAAH